MTSTYLVATCPYCNTRHVSFSLLREYSYPEKAPHFSIWALIRCGNCSCAAMSMSSRTYSSEKFPKPTLFPRVPTSPEHLPGGVDRLYSEALESPPTGAGMLFRKTLEVSMKIVRPNDNANLARRINNAAADGEITKDMAEWANHIRIIGNSAVHDEDPPAKEEIEELQQFVRLFLMYLFTLPGMLKESRKINRDGDART